MTTESRFHFWTLTRCRAAQARNTVDQQLRETPGRAFVILVLLAVIWSALYWILSEVLHQIGRYELQALAAKQQIFIHFFLVLAVMLAFSNAILAFGTLYGRREAAYLLCLPAPARQLVCVKWLEGMLLSSWSFLLLGVPLMLAVAGNTTVEWYYYPLFIGHFLGFIVIPSTLGLLAAWAVAMWAPRRPVTVVIWGAVLAALVAGVWAWSVARNIGPTDEWLRNVYRHLAVIQQPLLPSTWSARGVLASIERRAGLSLFYLAVVLANGVFLSWLTVNLVGRTWARTYSRVRQSRTRTRIREDWLSDSLCAVLFFYLPSRMRVMMVKDLRGFVRDPMQWTQMVIMLGLLLLYAANLRRLPLDLSSENMRAVVSFLNLVTISLIMATFTSRFVFPLLSLESQQLWLLGLLPEGRFRILVVKFAFSVTITALTGLLVMGLATRALGLSAQLAFTQLMVVLAICIGLSGLSVGLGARFPVLGQRNPARIASGFGGTVNLIASMVFVSLVMGSVAVAGLMRLGSQFALVRRIHMDVWIMPSILVFSMAVAAVSLWIGGRHFEKLEY